jgi:hypothetical protein
MMPRIIDGVHTIPVPHGWSPEQAWEAISRGELLKDPQPNWVSVIIKNGRYVELLEKRSEEDILMHEDEEQ